MKMVMGILVFWISGFAFGKSPANGNCDWHYTKGNGQMKTQQFFNDIGSRDCSYAIDHHEMISNSSHCADWVSMTQIYAVPSQNKILFSKIHINTFNVFDYDTVASQGCFIPSYVPPHSPPMDSGCMLTYSMGNGQHKGSDYYSDMNNPRCSDEISWDDMVGNSHECRNWVSMTEIYSIPNQDMVVFTKPELNSYNVFSTSDVKKRGCHVPDPMNPNRPDPMNPNRPDPMNPNRPDPMNPKHPGSNNETWISHDQSLKFVFKGNKIVAVDQGFGQSGCSDLEMDSGCKLGNMAIKFKSVDNDFKVNHKNYEADFKTTRGEDKYSHNYDFFILDFYKHSANSGIVTYKQFSKKNEHSKKLKLEKAYVFEVTKLSSGM